MDVTVLISTRDRAEHLRPTLDHIFRAAQESSLATEVVVIDNGSSDATRAVLDSVARGELSLRIVEDTKPGKSGALNRALPAILGRAILFTDDDVHVPVSWVSDMAEPILSGEADAVCGRLVLASHLHRPWLTKPLRDALAELTKVDGDLPGMVGANMAASKEAALATGFDENLGPGARGFADDVLFNLRLKAEGFRLLGSQGPPAEHHLDSDRISYAAMVDLAERSGASQAYVWHHCIHSQLKLLRTRRAVITTQLCRERLARRREPADGITENEFQLRYRRSLLRNLGYDQKTTPAYPASAPEVTKPKPPT